MIRFFSVIAVLGTFCGSSLAKQAAPAFQPRRSALSALELRGGAGPIDPELAAKLVAGACTLQAAGSILAVDKALDVYGFESIPVRQVIMQSVGGNFVTIGLPAALMLFKGMSLNEAFGYTGVLWSAVPLLMKKSLEEAGCALNGVWFGLALTVGT